MHTDMYEQKFNMMDKSSIKILTLRNFLNSKIGDDNFSLLT